MASRSITEEVASFVDFTNDSKSREYMRQLEEEENLMDVEPIVEADIGKRPKRTTKSSTKSYKDRLVDRVFDSDCGIDWFNAQCMKIDENLPTKQKMERLMINWTLWLQKLDKSKRYEDLMEIFNGLSNQAPKVRQGLENLYKKQHGLDTLDENIHGTGLNESNISNETPTGKQITEEEEEIVFNNDAMEE